MNHTQTSAISIHNYYQIKPVLTEHERQVYEFMKNHPNQFLLAYEWFVKMFNSCNYNWVKTINNVAPRIPMLKEKGYIDIQERECCKIITNEYGKLVEISKKANEFGFVPKTLFD